MPFPVFSNTTHTCSIFVFCFFCRTKLSKIASANQATIERSLHLLAAKLQHQSRPQGRERSVSVSFALAVRAAAFVLLHLLGQRVATGDHRPA